MSRQKRSIQAAVRVIQSGRKASGAAASLEKIASSFNSSSSRKFGIPNVIQMGHTLLHTSLSGGKDRPMAGAPKATPAFNFIPSALISRGGIVEVVSPSQQLCRHVAFRAARDEAGKGSVLWMSVGSQAPGGAGSSNNNSWLNEVARVPNLTVQHWPVTSPSDSRAVLASLLQLVRSQSYTLVVLDSVAGLAPPPPGLLLGGLPLERMLPPAGPVAATAGAAAAAAAAPTAPAVGAAAGSPAAAAAAPVAAAGFAPRDVLRDVPGQGRVDPLGAASPRWHGAAAAAAAHGGGAGSGAGAGDAVADAVGVTAAAGAAAAAEGRARGSEDQRAPAAAAETGHNAAVHLAGPSTGRSLGYGSGAGAAAAAAVAASTGAAVGNGATVVNLKFLHNVLPVLLEGTLSQLAVSCGPHLRTTTVLLNTYNRPSPPLLPGQVRAPRSGDAATCSSGGGGSDGYSGGGVASRDRSRWARRAIVRHATATLHLLPQRELQQQQQRSGGRAVAVDGGVTGGAGALRSEGESSSGGGGTLHVEVTSGDASSGEDGQARFRSTLLPLHLAESWPAS